ncbi:ion channel [Flocculibacter collagenilyticus]|uniref:ion channel n=1 Tax=Flocculibacter collagenilyticus TaxID=2744479 RepID=UPI0018F7407E|nr:ion channel [Flocculibacter collagenilyticus]
MSEREKCKYQSPAGPNCQEVDLGAGYCFWHDPNFDKQGLDVKEKLEKLAESGASLHGLKLKRVNLENVNLVKRGCTDAYGYDLSYSDFYRANMRGAHLFNMKLENGSLMKADLRDANLHCCKLKNTNLLGTKLIGSKIDNLEIGDELLQEAVAKQALKDRDIEKAVDHFEQSEEIYRDLRRAAEHQGLFSLGGKYIHKELTMRRYQYPHYTSKRLFSKFVDLFCGYGEQPLNVIKFSLSLIFICACLYFLFGIKYGDTIIQLDINSNFITNVSDFFSALYFSVVTFTTLGYGDLTPVGPSRIIAAVEAFTGSFTLALFVVVFVKKMTR